jgi:23S rRNA (guanosine2251-2'-O)-methyltransferase
MAGNQKRPGATRRIKKGPSIGTGGKGRKALEGKGPTPKAEDRPYHKAYKAKRSSETAADKRAGSSRGGGPRDRTSKADDVIIGRNSVLEALRAGLPANVLLVFERVDADDRITEIVSKAVEREIEVREVSKPVLDRLADGSPHQGVALEVAPYEYLQPGDLLEAPSPLRLIALDGIQDPRNLGAILRSAAAF